MFLLFAGSFYYPWGGWDDLIGVFDTMEEAIARGTAKELCGHSNVEWNEFDWCQVVDLNTLEVVYEWEDDSGGI